MTTSEQTGITYLPPGAGEALWVLGDQVTLKADGTRDGVTFFVGTISPGGGPPPHVHDQMDEVHYVLDGTLSFLGGETWQEAAAGSYIYIPRGVVHTFRNSGTEPARLLSTNNGPGGHERWFRHVGVPIADFATFTPPTTPPNQADVFASAAAADIHLMIPEHA
ncbi:MAG TPA: cupin domain-containing protein [Ktedonobacterales bacterium]|nr:cupin domain-containing protein [Ktedonobacterales bacterium]